MGYKTLEERHNLSLACLLSTDLCSATASKRGRTSVMNEKKYTFNIFHLKTCILIDATAESYTVYTDLMLI